MKILSMTATFGKLSHQTLTLEPGLNVIHAPNEWGKSTWCTFIVAMLYGIDTKERSTAAALADKEHYAPWSGEPMSGRMDILWNGKYITLERSSKGRVPFGVFSAYETQSGLPVPELTAANCGEMLLGVEKSVFTKSGFVRLADMPVVQDEALRRRLNALVTTGDESGTGDILAQKLRDLRNKCRHNKTGLLPQAEIQRDSLLEKLEQHKTLQVQLEQIRSNQQQLELQKKALENHRQALEYAAAEEGIRRLENAKTALQDAETRYNQLSARCQMLPAEDFATQQLRQLKNLQTQQNLLATEVLPQLPPKPEIPEIFAGISPADALIKAQNDKAAFDALSKKGSPLFLILAAISTLLGVGLAFMKWYLLIPCLLLGALLLVLQLTSQKKQASSRDAITAVYKNTDPALWIPLAEEYRNAMGAYQEQSAAARAVTDAHTQRQQTLQSSIHTLTQGLTIEEATQKWESVVAEHTALAAAAETLRQAQNRVADLSSAIQTVEPPAQPDTLTLSPAQTAQALQSAAAQLHTLQLQAGQCMGQKETLGAEEPLLRQLTAVQDRIAKLEDTYAALTVAMETLSEASDSLQRRFAPRIASRAQALFQKLTGGRYDRLQLTQDLSVNAAAEGENALQAARWRSEGTVDQLYLALRLSVAGELTPDAPLVLDDALVRFDDTRLAAAMEFLQEEATQKQVILFSCQSREQEYLPH